MNAEEFLNQEIDLPPCKDYQRDTLEAIILSGRGKMFLGKNYTPEDIEKMSTEEINHLYNKYKSVFGGRMAKSLSKTMVNLYTKLVNFWLPIESEEELKVNLESDPVVSNSIGDFASKLYVKFGCYLAPIITALITANNINFDSYKNGGTENNCDETEES